MGQPQVLPVGPPLVIPPGAKPLARFGVGAAVIGTPEAVRTVDAALTARTKFIDGVERLATSGGPAPRPTASAPTQSMGELSGRLKQLEAGAVLGDLVPGNAAQTDYPGERFPETRTRWIDANVVSRLSPEDLQYAINEMFARHGADFPKEETKRHFARFPWYRPRPGVDFDQIEGREFSDIEKANLKLLGAARDGLPLHTAPSPAPSTTMLPSTAAPQSARVPQAFHQGTWVMRRTDQNVKDTDYLTNTLRIDGSRFSYSMRFKSVLKPGAPPWSNPKIRHLKAFSGETVYRGSIVRVTADEIHARVESVDWPDPSPLDSPLGRMENRAKVGSVWRYAFRDGVLVDARNPSSVFRRP